jgi:hypothetical protein
VDPKIAVCYSVCVQVAMYRKLCEEQQKTRSNVESVPSNLQGFFYDFSILNCVGALVE